MEDIANSVHSVTTIMSQISVASGEKISGIEQVKKAIYQLDDVTQKNFALLEHTAMATQLLEEQTQHLTDKVSHFKMNDSSGRESSLSAVESITETQRNIPASVGNEVNMKTQAAENNAWEML